MLVVVLCATPALAQNFDTVAPKQPAPKQDGTIKTPPPVETATVASSKPLLDNLNGLRFVDSVQKIVRVNAIGGGIQIESLVLTDDPELRAQLSVFLGHPLMTGDLPKISKIVIDWYRAHNRPIVDVAFPEQDISSGLVQAVVTEYRLGQVKTSGNSWFSSDLLRGEMKTVVGSPVDFTTLKEDLNRLNRSPFRTVNAVFEKSDQVGATDIDLQVQDRFPFRAYVSFDNTGLPVTGRDHYSIGFNAANLLGRDEQFSYQYITSPDLWRNRRYRGATQSSDPRFTAHSGNYLLPLDNGDAINVFGFYVTQVPNLGTDFGQVGHGLQLSARYQIPLAVRGTFSQQLQFGVDYKRYDNNLAFGGTQIFASTTKIAHLLGIYDASWQDSWGQTALENQLVISPGNVLSGNDSATFAASGVAHASAGYVYDNLQITRVTNLPFDTSLVMRALGQLSSQELLPSEQLGAGGPDSVRGYDPRMANGSEGIVTSVELRSPSFTSAKWLGLADQGQLLAFWDYGNVSYKYAQTNLPRYAELQSLGFGARYSIQRFLELRLDYGWQLERAPGASKLGHLANVTVTLSY